MHSHLLESLSINDPSGIFTLHIQSELIHQIRSLLPIQGQQPRFSQIYIHDSDPHYPSLIRTSYYHSLLYQPITLLLQHMLQLQNPYIKVLWTAKERRSTMENISLYIKTMDCQYLDPRRYNHPISSEIAVIIPGTSEELVDRSDIVLQTRGGQLKHISELYSSYCPLRYPLLFPNGQQGWHPNIFSNIYQDG